MLLRRLLWSIVIAIVIMIPVGILNYIIYPNAENIPETERTVAQQIAIQQRYASFVTITVVEMSSFFIIGFLIADRFFTANPDKHTMIEIHKSLHPNIPKEFYKIKPETDETEGKEK